MMRSVAIRRRPKGAALLGTATVPFFILRGTGRRLNTVQVVFFHLIEWLPFPHAQAWAMRQKLGRDGKPGATATLH